MFILSCEESRLRTAGDLLEEVWIDSITGDDKRCVCDGFLAACHSLEQAAVTANHTGSLTVYINAFATPENCIFFSRFVLYM